MKKTNRLLSLDYLRGFFIIIIIIDHFSRWPNILGIFSGQALLWVTAAEGFVIISGVLVGYVRGSKNRQLPFRTVTANLLKRSLLLYAWSIIGTIAYVAIVWYVQLKGGVQPIPFDIGEWGELLANLFTLQYTYIWLHFLTLYAIFLAASPLAIWLFRKNKAWLVAVISLVLLVIGWITHSEVLQWQALFFIPSIAGYYLESIRSTWKNISATKRGTYTALIWILTLTTLIVSSVFTFLPGSFIDIAHYVNNTLFDKDTISVWRILISFLWFIGFLLFFSKIDTFITKYMAWLLLPFGTRSLTAYIIHGLAIYVISYFTVTSENIYINTLLGSICIMLVWGLVRLPFVQKLFPR